MSQEAPDSIWSGLASLQLYKRRQGRVTRRTTAAAVAAISVLGAWALQRAFLLDSDSSFVRYGVPGAIALAGCWLAFRVVNLERFAEFLIATESEVEKVHWPDRQYVHRAAVVVIVTMLLVGGLLFTFDFMWQMFFSWIGFLEIYEV